jgi:hypothetical protein
MLPPTVKSLAEIEPIEDIAIRATCLAILFEHVLKGITPNARSKDLRTLADENEWRLKKFQQSGDLRVLRNWIIHGEQKMIPTQVLHAESALHRAIESVLLSKDCPPSLRADARGVRKAPASPVENSSQAPPPASPRVVSSPPSTPPPQPPTPEPPPPQPPLPHSTPIAPAPSFPVARSSVGWFVLGGSLLIAAAIGGAIAFSRSQTVAPAQRESLPPRGPEPSNVDRNAPTRIVQTQASSPATAQGSPAVGPLLSPTPPAQTRLEQSPAPTIPSSSRGEGFQELINTKLSKSSTQPNVALLIDSTGTGAGADALQGFLTGTKVRIIANLADVNALKSGGFFDQLYAGNSGLLGQAIQLSHVDYILVGKATYSFRRQAGLDPDLLTCDLTLSVRLADHSGTVVQSASFSALGPGFSESQALERASENAAQQLKSRIIDSIQ